MTVDTTGIPLIRKNTCSSCRHWDQEDDRGGSCRRYPPVAIVAEGDVEDMLPSTQLHDWCGEWGANERKPMACLSNGDPWYYSLPIHCGRPECLSALRVRAQNCIRDHTEASTVADVAKMGRGKLRRIRGLGQTSLNDIERWLAPDNWQASMKGQDHE